jgi:hypothetical protein
VTFVSCQCFATRERLDFTSREFLNEEVTGGMNPDRDMRLAAGRGAGHETTVSEAFSETRGPTVSLTAVPSLQV